MDIVANVSKREKIKRYLAICFLVALTVGVFFSVYGDLTSNKFTVCIDAGHGGSSIGAVYKNDERLEKDDNLRLAQLLETELQKRSVKVIMTRERDKDVSLSKRCRIANMNKADYFVCLHRNSSDNADAHGTEIWVSENASDIEIAFAENILSQLANVGVSDNRGVKYGYRDGDGDYYINRNSNMPSSLVELGFISNYDDNCEYDENIKEYAEALADAIVSTYEENKNK